jgi:membrane protease YdiL (CAAX protease family)
MAVVALTLWLVLSYLSSMLAEAIFGQLLKSHASLAQSIGAYDLTLTVLQLISVLVGVVIPMVAIWRSRASISAWFGLKWHIWSLPIWLAILFAILLLVGGLDVAALDVIFSSNNKIYLFWSNNAYMLLFSLIISQPIVEELLFRGFLQTATISAIGAVPGVIVVALAWAISHFNFLGTEDMYYYYFLLTILGLLFGAARYFTRSIYIAIFLHMANNVIAIAAG